LALGIGMPTVFETFDPIALHGILPMAIPETDTFDFLFG
jgi:hypothetical protein